MPRHRLFTTHPGSEPEDPARFPLAPFAAGLLAGSEFRFPPSPPRKKWHLEWPVALLLHAAVIALALITFQPRMSLDTASQTPVSIVEDNTGAPQAAAPPAPANGPPKVAQLPPPPPPPPAAQASPLAPEENLEIPQDLFSQMPLPPQPQAPPQQQARVFRPAHHRTVPAHQQYQVMNGMSLGNSSAAGAAPGSLAPPLPNAQHGLNLQLSQSDLNALNTPEITVEGNIGSDWMSGFDKWVNAHIYYPQAAIEQGQEGTSVIQFTVHRDGHVTDVRLLSSAGSTFLDQAWLGIFLQNNVPPFPPGTKSDTIKITAALEYRLLQ